MSEKERDALIKRVATSSYNPQGRTLARVGLTKATLREEVEKYKANNPALEQSTTMPAQNEVVVEIEPVGDPLMQRSKEELIRMIRQLQQLVRDLEKNRITRIEELPSTQPLQPAPPAPPPNKVANSQPVPAVYTLDQMFADYIKSKTATQESYRDYRRLFQTMQVAPTENMLELYKDPEALQKRVFALRIPPRATNPDSKAAQKRAMKAAKAAAADPDDIDLNVGDEPSQSNERPLYAIRTQYKHWNWIDNIMQASKLFGYLPATLQAKYNAMFNEVRDADQAEEQVKTYDSIISIKVIRDLVVQKYGANSMESVLVHLYEAVPLRDNFGDMIVVMKDYTTVNLELYTTRYAINNLMFFDPVGQDVTLYIRFYKQASRGPIKVYIPQTHAMLKEYIDSNNLKTGDYLFFNKKSKRLPMYKSMKLSQFAKKILESVGIESKQKIYYLRHSSISTFMSVPQAKTDAKYVKWVAEMAGHSVRQQQGYIRQIAENKFDPMSLLKDAIRDDATREEDKRVAAGLRIDEPVESSDESEYDLSFAD